MKVITQSPAQAPNTNTVPTPEAKSARDRAIAALMGDRSSQAPQAQTQESPVLNANQVAPEELAAVKAPEQTDSSVESPQTPEASKPKEPEVKKSTDESLSSQYAVLARKEKALRQERLKFQSEQKAFLEQKSALESSKAPAAPAQPSAIDRERLLRDPLGVLTEAGITWDQLTQQALNPPSHSEIQLRNTIGSLEAKIKAIEAAQENQSKGFKDQQTQAYQQAVQQLKTETTHLVSNDPSYEMIKATNSVEDVVQLIERTYKEDKRLMTVEEAATEVEQYLVEEAYKLAQAKKVQERLKPQASAKPAESQKQQSPEQSQTKTLTNSIGSTRQLSARERAILAFKGELKS